jgi:hypothetical protein
VIPLRKITPPPSPPKPNDTTQVKINNKKRKFTPTNIDKPSTSASTRNNTKLNMVPNNNKTCEPKFKQTMNDSNTCSLDYNVIEDMKKTK